MPYTEVDLFSLLVRSRAVGKRHSRMHGFHDPARAGRQRGGFGVNFEVTLHRGEARASFVMGHGRCGPQGALGGADGGVNKVRLSRGGETYVPPHLS